MVGSPGTSFHRKYHPHSCCVNFRAKTEVQPNLKQEYLWLRARYRAQSGAYAYMLSESDGIHHNMLTAEWGSWDPSYPPVVLRFQYSNFPDFKLRLSLNYSKRFCPWRGYNSVKQHLLLYTITNVNTSIYLIRVEMGGKRKKWSVQFLVSSLNALRNGFVRHKNWLHTTCLIQEDRWHQTLSRRCFREDSNPRTDRNIHWSYCSHSVSKVWSWLEYGPCPGWQQKCFVAADKWGATLQI